MINGNVTERGVIEAVKRDGGFVEVGWLVAKRYPKLFISAKPPMIKSLAQIPAHGLFLLVVSPMKAVSRSRAPL